MDGRILRPGALYPGDFLARVDRATGFNIAKTNQIMAAALDRAITLDSFGFTLDSGATATAMTAISGLFTLGTLEDPDYFASWTIADTLAAGYVASTRNGRVSWVSNAIRDGKRLLLPGEQLVLNYAGGSASTAGAMIWVWSYPVGEPTRV